MAPQSRPGNDSISCFGEARSTVKDQPLSPEDIAKYNDWFKASLYLSLGMIYLRKNPLLREPLKIEHIKGRLLGHFGSAPGQIFTYMHFNRLIKKYDLNAFFVSGPGHGAPAVLSQAYLEGTYSEVYPEKTEDVEGMQRFFKDFSFPGGIGSHATPETPARATTVSSSPPSVMVAAPRSGTDTARSSRPVALRVHTSATLSDIVFFSDSASCSRSSSSGSARVRRLPNVRMTSSGAWCSP